MPGYDSALRRRGRRSGRERGCWTYIPAEELSRVGIDPTGPPPLYRTAARQGGRTVIVTLYASEELLEDERR